MRRYKLLWPVSYTHLPLEEEKHVVRHSEELQKNIFKEPALWMLGLATLCCFFSCYGMYAYLAEYLYTLDYSSSQVGTMVFLNGFILSLIHIWSVCHTIGQCYGLPKTGKRISQIENPLPDKSFYHSYLLHSILLWLIGKYKISSPICHKSSNDGTDLVTLFRQIPSSFHTCSTSVTV